jgi:hypothetical protein
VSACGAVAALVVVVVVADHVKEPGKGMGTNPKKQKTGPPRRQASAWQVSLGGGQDGFRSFQMEPLESVIPELCHRYICETEQCQAPSSLLHIHPPSPTQSHSAAGLVCQGQRALSNSHSLQARQHKSHLTDEEAQTQKGNVAFATSMKRTDTKWAGALCQALEREHQLFFLP